MAGTVGPTVLMAMAELLSITTGLWVASVNTITARRLPGLLNTTRGPSTSTWASGKLAFRPATRLGYVAPRPRDHGARGGHDRPQGGLARRATIEGVQDSAVTQRARPAGQHFRTIERRRANDPIVGRNTEHRPAARAGRQVPQGLGSATDRKEAGVLIGGAGPVRPWLAPAGRSGTGGRDLDRPLRWRRRPSRRRRAGRRWATWLRRVEISPLCPLATGCSWRT